MPPGTRADDAKLSGEAHDAEATIDAGHHTGALLHGLSEDGARAASQGKRGDSVDDDARVDWFAVQDGNRPVPSRLQSWLGAGCSTLGNIAQIKESVADEARCRRSGIGSDVETLRRLSASKEGRFDEARLGCGCSYGELTPYDGIWQKKW
ncbi:hypothetical protein BESB_047080 [Besnoitia besnoiti]|uniref:Uncharacterized protein n=1 Tax=Besnoitia besnoiti TaxID=94643 RepID=A0A2A9MKK2_BESBE|nr:hypothetical protein BESB_047080 [Besnoitia besnoiti]PFH36516.1 hypothetical protein BESB_047080 [Besnoitia besnoiti]